MKPKYITGYWEGDALTLFPEIAAQFNLRSGARLLNQEQFWAVLEANAKCGIAGCELQLAIAKDFDPEIQEVERV